MQKFTYKNGQVTDVIEIGDAEQAAMGDMDLVTIHVVTSFTTNEQRVADRSTRIIGEEWYRRLGRERDHTLYAEPWFVLEDGQYVPVNRMEVPWQVRDAWVHGAQPIKKSGRRPNVPVRKHYTDEDIDAWLKSKGRQLNFAS